MKKKLKLGLFKKFTSINKTFQFKFSYTSSSFTLSRNISKNKNFNISLSGNSVFFQLFMPNHLGNSIISWYLSVLSLMNVEESKGKWENSSCQVVNSTAISIDPGFKGV